jgi:hypothetical protein
MKRLAFAIGLLALGFVAVTTAAQADYAVVKFGSGFCRVWDDTPWGPQDGKYLWFRRHWGWHHWHYRFHTYGRASYALARAHAHGRCPWTWSW